MSVFPNLAHGFDIQNETLILGVTETCRRELLAAGIRPFIWGGHRPKGEVPTRCVGARSGWSFERMWYYWVATGPGIPPEIAYRLHASHGQEVRVSGHGGAPDPSYYKGFAVGSYHVDTPEGLKALADTLKSIWDDSDQDPK